MGADVRLVLPGRCLNCFGGIGGGRENGRRPRRERFADTDLETARDDHAWRLERAGSLLSLNGLAVNLGLRLIEDFLAGRVGETTWLHLEYDANGIPSIDHFGPSDVPSISCPTCRLTGLGDRALNHFRDVVGGGG